MMIIDPPIFAVPGRLPSKPRQFGQRRGAFRRALKAAAFVFACVSGTAAQAATDGAAAASAGQAQYIFDRERCNDPSQYQDKAACLREAAAAKEARRPDPLPADAQAADRDAEYQRNRALRCDPLPADQRADCLNRMQGQGLTEGSVGAGGIYRESVTREIGAQPGVVPVEIK